MRHLTRSILFALTIAFAATSAMAFPTWIGTYGAFERHSNANPGTFTILMNQDYVGLHAEVGVQVNGGTWTTYGMAYGGNADGNSKWTVTPAAAFPAGATVKFYFHGWDDWGGHIYDNNNTQDYAYVAPGSSTGSVGWTTSPAVPANGGLYMDIAAYNGTVYAVWAERADWNQPETVLFSKKAAGEGWTAPSQLASVSGGMTYPRIAASSRGVHVLYGDNNATRLINSANGGSTWSASIDVASDYSGPLCRYGELRADDTYTYLAYDNFTAPETSRVRFRRIHKDATAWEAERTVYDRSSYKATVYVKDFEVRGQKVALSTYSQGWYGGMGTPFYHESTDGGQTWTERAVGSYAASYQIDADAAGHVHMATMGGPAGDGLYTAHKDIGSAWGAFSLFWPGGGTIDCVAKIDAGLVAVSTRNELRYYELSTDGGATWSAPALIAGGNSWVSKDVRDGNTVHLLAIDYNSGLYTVVSSGSAGAPAVTWIGNTYHWPSGSELDATDDLWINVESTPRGAATSAGVAYSTDNGANWTNKAMTLGGQAGANDWWHANLGKFAAGTTVRYAVAVTDGRGTTRWDNNGGQDYRATVASSVIVQTPVFWGLDPYRYDNAKARANGRAPQESNNSFGQFDAGQAVTIVARPVENGNGNLVQTSCSSTALLHYTTTPGDWSNAQTVQGVFSPAGLSNKPIFDFFSFDLGTFPAGTSVEFWMEAKNAAGTGYAQSAGNDFDFSIAAAVGDSDSDGLPDQWELDYFGNLGQSATNNNSDLDGPTYFPIANIIEWVLGLSPSVPNDSMGIKLLWSPAYPSPGEQVNLSYFYVNEGNPLFGKPIYAHVGHNGWQGVYDTAQFGLNGRISRFQATIIVPAGATEINVCFHDNAGTWDNNGGQNWRIPVQPAGGGGGGAAPTPAKTALASATPATDTTAAAPQTLTVKWTSPRSGQWTLVAGEAGWKNAAQIPMRTAANGTRWATYTLPEGATRVVFAFRKQGQWETNNGRAWSVVLAGGGNHTLSVASARPATKVIQRTLKKSVRK